MQFIKALSILSASLIATGLAAPSPLHLDISVDKKDSGGPGICLAVCWPDPSLCPFGWSEKNLSYVDDEPCWTCCRDTSSTSAKQIEPIKPVKQDAPKKDEISVVINVNSDDKFHANEICLKVCWPETPTCPDGWYSNNFGTAYEPCWTCCKAPSKLLSQEM